MSKNNDMIMAALMGLASMHPNPKVQMWGDEDRYSNSRGRVSVNRPKKKKKFGKKK